MPTDPSKLAETIQKFIEKEKKGILNKMEVEKLLLTKPTPINKRKLAISQKCSPKLLRTISDLTSEVKPAKPSRSEDKNTNDITIVDLKKQNDLLLKINEEQKSQIQALQARLDAIEAGSSHARTSNSPKDGKTPTLVASSPELCSPPIKNNGTSTQVSSGQGQKQSPKKTDQGLPENKPLINHHASPTDASSAPTTQGRKPRPPPIIVQNQSAQETINQILFSGHKITGNFRTKKSTQTSHTLYIDLPEDYTTIVNILKEKNTPFHSFTPKYIKSQTILLKNLEGDFENDSILETLNNQKIINTQFLKVNRFSTKKSTLENRKLPIFVVHLTPDSNLNNVHQIKKILHQSVSWEKIISKEITQCWKCQRLGHSSTNCNLAFRCVKCSESHEVGNCKLTNIQENTTNLKCALCGNNDHPASYKGCPVTKNHKQNILTQQIKQHETNIKKTNKIQKLVNPQLSYSQITASTLTNKPTHAAPNPPNNSNTSVPRFNNAPSSYSLTQTPTQLMTQSVHNPPPPQNNPQATQLQITDILLDIKKQLNTLNQSVQTNTTNIYTLFKLLPTFSPPTNNA